MYQTVAGLVTALASLPLGRQDKFLLLRSSLQARLAHLTRITSWSRLSPHVVATERQVLLAALDLVEHPRPAVMQSDPVVAQFALPLRSGGFGLRLTTPLLTPVLLHAQREYGRHLADVAPRLCHDFVSSWRAFSSVSLCKCTVYHGRLNDSAQENGCAC
jgi:hypothetical protein